MEDVLVKYNYKWSLISDEHSVRCRKVYGTSEKDEIICNLISSEGGIISLESIGFMLGFAMDDLLLNDEIRFHKDFSEISVLKKILNELEEFHLVLIEDQNITLTKWGQFAIEYKQKFKFFRGVIDLHSHLNFKIAAEYFPIRFADLDLYSKVNLLKEISPYDIPDTLTAFTQLSIAYSSRCRDNINLILDYVEDTFLNKNEIVNDVILNLSTDRQTLEVFYRDFFLKDLTDSLYLDENIELKKYLTKRGLFEFLLLSDSTIKLSDLKEYQEFFNWKDIINSNRIDWKDPAILDFFKQSDISNGTIWSVISEKCPLEILLENVEGFSEYLNWSTLTHIATTELIFNEYHLPWDLLIALEKLSSDQIPDFIKNKLLNHSHEEYTTVFDNEHWNLITAKMPIESMQNTINEYPYNFRYITRNHIEITLGKILLDEFIHMDWDWGYISNQYDLDFLATNFTLLSKFLDTEKLFLRISSEEERLIRFLKSKRTIDLKKRLLEDEIRISFHNVVLNEITLPALDTHNLLYWGTDIFPGVEANENILWTYELFQLYNSRILSKQAIDQVSKSFDDVRIVLDNPSFKWNYVNVFNYIETKDLANNLQGLFKNVPISSLPEIYSIVSKKINIEESVYSVKLLPILAKELDFRQIIRNSTPDQLIICVEDLNNLWPLFEDKRDNLITLCTEIISLDFILDHLELVWDWRYITRIKISNDSIEEYFDEYTEFLDWEYIVKEIMTDVFLNDISKLTEIAVYVSQSAEDIITKSWAYITSSISPENIWTYIASTTKYDFFKWDWTVISGSNKIMFSKFNDLAFLWNNREKIDWLAFSSNKLFKSWIKQIDAESTDRWFKRTSEFVDTFVDFLPWEVLSKLNDFTWNERIVQKYLKYWNWTVLSQYSRCFVRFEEKIGRSIFIKKRLNKFYDQLDFYALSARTEVQIESDFIQEYADENLNWGLLSSNTNFKINMGVFVKKNSDNGLIFLTDSEKYRIADKDWDYYAISSRTDIELDPDFILLLADKNWDWVLLSAKPFVNNSLLLETSDKPWDFSVICDNDKLIFDINLIKLIVKKTTDYKIDWHKITSYTSFHITNETLSVIPKESLPELDWNNISSSPGLLIETLTTDFLDKYGMYLVWGKLLSTKKLTITETILVKYHRYISSIDLSKYLDINILHKHEFSFVKDLINWSELCDRDDVSELMSDIEFIELNKKYLDWSNLSANIHLPFTESFITQFRLNWDWNRLRQNPVIKERLLSFVNNMIQSDKKLDFYIKITNSTSRWSGFIYHFAHLTNALKIIKDKSIKSRNKAVFEDSAGSVVNRRHDAHAYARFYFRPQTPTQFYNENLGMDKSSGYYDRAYNMGLPKCPIPIFFRFPLKDVLFDNKLDYRISNGNMQTGWATPYPIESISSFFDFGNIFSTIQNTTDGDFKTYINSSQQEFLIKDEFNFSEYFDYQIIVPDSIIKQYILDSIDDPTISNKIIIDDGATKILHRNNKSINLNYDQKVLQVSTDYCNSHKFLVKFNSEYLIKDISGVDLVKRSESIEFKKNCTISFLNEPKFELLFFNEIKPIPWTIMQFGNKKN